MKTTKKRKKQKKDASVIFFFLSLSVFPLSSSSSSSSFKEEEGGKMGDFVDHELLLSVASGIGRWVDGPAGAVYERDEDCLGEEMRKSFFFLRLISTMPSVFVRRFASFAHPTPAALPLQTLLSPLT